MKRLTIILAHSDYEKSIANREIMEQLLKQYPESVVRNVASLYPNFDIDVAAEQKNLLESDVIVFQFPINWFNVPSILKHWIDVVLTYGFAYGAGGDLLKGKTVLVSATAGGSKESYTPIGHMRFHLPLLLYNIEATVYYCQMNYAEPVLGYGNIYIPSVVNTPEIVKARASEQAQRLIVSLNNLLKD